MIAKIAAGDFDAQVLKSSLPVLVDFFADWCGPCKMAEPVLEDLAQTYSGKINFVKVNVDESGELSSKYGVMSIPTTVLYVKGEEVGRQVGFAGKEGFENLLQKSVSSIK